MVRATTDDPRWRDTQRRSAAARREELRVAARRPLGRNIEEGARLAAAASTLLGTLRRDPRT